MKHISEILAGMSLPAPVESQSGRTEKPEIKPNPKCPDAPPIRFELTEDQVKLIEEAKPAASGTMVCGYASRHPWPDPDQFTLSAWFVDSEALEEALKGAGVMAKRFCEAGELRAGKECP